MRKYLVLLLGLVFLSGCAGVGNKLPLMGAKKGGKTAKLKYTKVGITSNFEFKGIVTGTYKSLGAEAGFIYYKGSQNVKLTLKAVQKWSILATSKRQNFRVAGLGLRLQNPYVAVIKRNGRHIGNIGLSLPRIDKTKTLLKYVGLDHVINKNLDLKGRADILGRKYTISSVYKGTDGVTKNSPYGYRVSRRGRTLGLIQVGKNMVGGQVLSVWIAPNLGPVTEESVMASLLVCGYAI